MVEEKNNERKDSKLNELLLKLSHENNICKENWQVKKYLIK